MSPFRQPNNFRFKRQTIAFRLLFIIYKCLYVFLYVRIFALHAVFEIRRSLFALIHLCAHENKFYRVDKSLKKKTIITTFLCYSPWKMTNKKNIFSALLSICSQSDDFDTYSFVASPLSSQLSRSLVILTSLSPVYAVVLHVSAKLHIPFIYFYNKNHTI